MNVIIVDDDRTTVEVIEQNMDWKALGIEGVYTAYNIAGAKKIIEAHPIDIVISDIEMPKGSGLDLLSWFREQKQDGEFLLLTSHERFDYATYAVRLHASEYLLKPFDPVIMEATLQKIVAKRREELAKKASENQGQWLASNMRQVRLSFFRHRLESEDTLRPNRTEEELKGLDLPQNPKHRYTLIISRVTEMERDIETVRQELFDFIVTNIHGEILCGSADDGNVVLFREEGQMLLASVVDATDENVIQNRTKALEERFHSLFKATLTMCVTEPTVIDEFAKAFRACKDSFQQYVPGYGSTYFLRDVPTADSIDHQMLPVAEMVSLLQKGDKFGFLSLVKSALDEYGHNRGLTGEHLRRMYRELSQVVYTVLGDAGISVTDLFDEDLSVLARNAQSSTMGMIRFSNYLVERALDVIAETKQKETLADKVDRYIRENYRREITTGELGEFFHMNGEYLNKSYRKERGVGIKDALNEYRIQEAKKLLLGSDEAISNIATEVGFDNFTYFSTLFKKYTGSTPSQFRKTESGV